MKAAKFLTTVFAAIICVSPCMAGYIYVSNPNTPTITQYNSAGTASTVENSFYATGLAFGPNGNLYAAQDRSIVYQVAPGGAVSVFQNSFVGGTNYGILNGNLGLVFDHSGNLYVGENYSNSLTKVTPGGTRSNFSGNLGNGPQNTAIDSSGNFYVARQDSTVMKVTAAGASTVFNSGLSQAWGIAIDSSDNIFVSNRGTNQIVRFAAGSNTFSVFATISTGVGAMAFDSAGNLFVVSTGKLLEFASGSNTATVFANQSSLTVDRSFIATSSTDISGTPEPASWSLLAIGGFAFAFRRRKN